jgi:DNA repair exonuclease SbcCD ATPase subunit
MLFDPGNIITLVLVAIVLGVYRFLDRDNRSLEKVKKYTDRIRDDLGVYVDQRSEDLKSYGIELDVRSKSAKEVLKRVKEAEEEFSSRSDSLEAMGKRVAEYDIILARLADMTGRVDENLKLVHEESVFADQLAKKLKDSEETLARIDREVPLLREHFAEDSQKALAETRDGIIAQAKDRLDATVEQVEALRADTEQRREQVAAFYREANEQAKARYVEMDKLLANAFVKAREEGEQLEDASYEKFREQIDARGDKLKEALDAKLKSLQEAAKERIIETQGLVKGFKGEWQKDARELMDSTQAEISGLSDRLSARIDEIGANADKTEATVTARLDKIETKALEVAQALQTKVKDQLKAHQDELVQRQAEIRAELSKYDASGKEMEKEIQALLAGINEKLTKEAAALEEKTLLDFNKRVEEYRAEVEYKFERLSESNIDIQHMEDSLRAAMAGTETRVEEDFSLFGKDLTARQTAFEEEFQAEAARVRGNMESVEKDINTLKASAYQNVSEKLKLFEDDFFVDLKTRSESIDKRLDEWQETLAGRLAEISGSEESKRQEMAKQASEELRAGMAEVQNQLFEQLHKLSEQAQNFQTGLTAQMANADGSLASLKESVQTDLKEARAGADAYMHTELERYRVDGEQQIKEAERALTSAQAVLVQNIAKLTADWEKQRTEITENSRAERQALAKELEAAGTEIARFRQELTQKTGQAMEGLGRSYENFTADAQKRARAIAAELDQKAQAFQQTASEFSARFEKEASERDHVLSDMDARIKGFAAQTKLFDRADELQKSLQTSIEVLKGDLARVDSRKGELVEMETQFQRVKRMGDETDQKITRFLAEKRRIDTMEEDFKRLLGLSQDVDRKLASVTENRDSLTDLEAEFRRVSSLADETGTKFDRLEKKSALLDTTVEGVDKSFETLRGIEKDVKDLEQRVHPLIGQTDELQSIVGSLNKGRDKIDSAVSRLGDLDKELDETEKRIEKVQKAREWLAHTESRMEELNKQAQDQLKLLGTLLKDEGGSRKKESGAPSLSAQETVRKLAHQGWKVEEIARAVKLSRGEVELILELGAPQ